MWVVAVVVHHLVVLSLGAGPVPVQGVLRPPVRAVGGHHAVGRLARHHRPAVHPALRLQLRHHQPRPACGCTSSTRRSTSSATTAGRCPSMVAVGVFVSLPFTTYVLLAGLGGDPGRRRRRRPASTARARGSLLAHHPAAAAPGAAGRDGAEHHLRVQLASRSSTPSTTATPASPTTRRSRSCTSWRSRAPDKDVGMSAAAGVVQRAADPRRRRGLPARHHGGRRRPMSTTTVLDTGSSTVPGGIAAPPRRVARVPRRAALRAGRGGVRRGRVVRAPYLVMLLDALRPERRRAGTPPTLFLPHLAVGHLRHQSCPTNASSTG